MLTSTLGLKIGICKREKYATDRRQQASSTETDTDIRTEKMMTTISHVSSSRIHWPRDRHHQHQAASRCCKTSTKVYSQQRVKHQRPQQRCTCKCSVKHDSSRQQAP